MVMLVREIGRYGGGYELRAHLASEWVRADER